MRQSLKKKNRLWRRYGVMLLIYVHRSLAQELNNKINSAVYHISSIIGNVYNHKTETSTQSLLLSRDLFSIMFLTQFEFSFTNST